MKPLTLSQVAEQTGFHVSTISRAVKDKYISTPRGTISLKELFKPRVQRSGNTAKIMDTSPDYIKNLITRLIDQEDSAHCLSDRQLAEYLKYLGISRRTVSKYRKEMGIPSSSKRKGISLQEKEGLQ